MPPECELPQILSEDLSLYGTSMQSLCAEFLPTLVTDIFGLEFPMQLEDPPPSDGSPTAKRHKVVNGVGK